MAVIKFTNSKSNVKAILDYITQSNKTEERYITGKDCVPRSAFEEMQFVKKMYGKDNGRQYIHIVQSFDPKDTLSYETANQIGLLLAERFKGFQAVIATHQDRQHIHNHILLNSVNFETGLKFQQSKKDMQAVKDFSDELCYQFGLGVIEKPNKGGYIPQGEYQEALRNESWKIDLINTIDYAISLSKTKEDFISHMNRFGYGVTWTHSRKNITYTTPDGKKCRDSKLHRDKYLKEEMELEFRRIKEKSIGEVAYHSDGQAGTPNKQAVGGNEKNLPAIGANPSNTTGDKKQSLLQQLDHEKAKIRDNQNQKRPAEKNNTNRGR